MYIRCFKKKNKIHLYLTQIVTSARHFRIESNRDVQFEFESNLEASQVPNTRILQDAISRNSVGGGERIGPFARKIGQHIERL